MCEMIRETFICGDSKTTSLSVWINHVQTYSVGAVSNRTYTGGLLISSLVQSRKFLSLTKLTQWTYSTTL